MREFLDGSERAWLARVREEPGRDYKGRYYFYFAPADGTDGEGLALLDVRWNSSSAADSALTTMSEVELRRRLRSARGRGSPEAPTDGIGG